MRDDHLVFAIVWTYEELLVIEKPLGYAKENYVYRNLAYVVILSYGLCYITWLLFILCLFTVSRIFRT